MIASYFGASEDQDKAKLKFLSFTGSPSLFCYLFLFANMRFMFFLVRQG